MSLPTYEVFVRNAAYQRLDRLDDFSLAFVQRWNDVGTWTMELPADGVAAGLLDTSGGIVVNRDGSTIFSGRVTTRTRTITGVKYAGVDDNVLLADTLVLPTPDGPPYAEYYTDEDTASTVMRSLVQAQMASAARADRQISALNLETSDPLLGGSVLVRARFVSMLALLQELAVAPNAGGLRFWIAQSDDDPDQILFRIREATDRRSTVIFSKVLGTIEDYEDTWQAPTATYLYLAGGDDMDPDRTIVEGGSSSAELEAGRRIEVWQDARNTATEEEMRQTHAAALQSMAATRKVTVEVVQSDSLVWGTDYDLGDLVSVVDADSTTYEDVIREIEVKLTARDGARVTPLVGAVGTSNDSDSADGRVARAIDAVDARVSHLEKNWRMPAATISSIQNLPAGTVTNTMLDAAIKWNPGNIRLTAAASAATGWLLCQGQVLSQSTYNALYAAIGTAFNTGGEGAGNFRLPNFQQRFPMGADGSYTLGSRGGSMTIDTTHDHGGTTGVCDQNEDGRAGTPSGLVAADGHAHPISEDGNASQSVLNPYLAINYEIFAGV